MSATPNTAIAAPVTARVKAQSLFETRTLLANGEQLLAALILPALALVGLTAVGSFDLGPGQRIDIVTPGILALAIISTAFTGQAIATGFDRRYGVLRLLGTTPLGRSGLVAARVIAVLVVEVIQFVVLGGIALALGWHPAVLGLPVAALVWILGTATFVTLALWLAGTIRAEGVLALANILWVLMLGFGVVIPAATLPSALSTVAGFTPGGALGEALRAALQHATFDAGSFGVLLIWFAIGAFAANRWFRWSD